MITIPAKVKDRLVAGLKKFQPILRKAKDKDINESDTVTIITDIFSDVLGYDKYSEITSEYVVKKTFCDLAIEIDQKVTLLIEIKAAGLALKDDYIRQAVDYGSNAGIDWIVLTNGIHWKIYRVIFSKPVVHELIYEFHFAELNSKKQSDLEMLFYICREAMAKTSGILLSELAVQRQVLNHFFVGQLLLTEPMLDALRKLLRKMAPDVKTTNAELGEILETSVIKRDVFDGDRSDEAKKRIRKYERSLEKTKEKKVEQDLVEIN